MLTTGRGGSGVGGGTERGGEDEDVVHMNQLSESIPGQSLDESLIVKHWEGCSYVVGCGWVGVVGVGVGGVWWMWLGGWCGGCGCGWV